MRAILTWHSLDTSGSAISVAPETFRRQVAWLASGRVRVVSIADLLAMDDDSDAVALTFDDGFSNFATEALPLLHEHGFPATVFVVAEYVGGDNRWGGRSDGVPIMPLLGWDDLAGAVQKGVEIGAHSCTHPLLPSLGETALADELARAAVTIERRLGTRPGGFAYPYGVADDRVAAATGQHYAWACTDEFRPLSAGLSRMMLPRLDAWYFRHERMLAPWGTPRFRSWAWARRQARRVRRTARRIGIGR